MGRGGVRVPPTHTGGWRRQSCPHGWACGDPMGELNALPVVNQTFTQKQQCQLGSSVLWVGKSTLVTTVEV